MNDSTNFWFVVTRLTELRGRSPTPGRIQSTEMSRSKPQTGKLISRRHEDRLELVGLLPGERAKRDVPAHVGGDERQRGRQRVEDAGDQAGDVRVHQRASGQRRAVDEVEQRRRPPA